MSGKSVILGAIGIIFVAVALTWFFSPISEWVVMALSGESRPANAESVSGKPVDQDFWETLHLALDGLNAFIGIVGLYLTLKAIQSSRGFNSNVTN